MEVTTENPTENNENTKRKLEKTILDNFSKLTNPHENVRIKSAANLLRHLAENNQNEKELNEVRYALKRLVRGLGASTSSARAGYFSTLVALLNLNPKTSISELLDFIKTELHTSGKNSDGENADICVGQILTCGAIIKANLWDKCNEECQNQLLDVILNASKQRTYLGLIGYSFIIELFHHLSEKQVETILLTKIKPEIQKPWSEQSLDSLFLMLSLKEKCPSICNKKFFRSILNTPDIVCGDTLEDISNILMAIPRATSLKHPVYKTIVYHVKSAHLLGFYEELNKHLKTPNRNRLLGFLRLLINTLSTIKNSSATDLKLIPEILTTNFIIQILGYFRTFKGKQRDKEYHDLVQSFFEALLITLKVDGVSSEIKIEVLRKFLFNPGTFVFEKVTKSKIIQQITQSLDTSGVKTLSALYRKVTDGTEEISTENDSEMWLNNDRLYSAHLLIKLLNLPNMKEKHQWKAEQLEFLMCISLLREENGYRVGRELAESLKHAFYGALDLKLSKLEELHSILYQLAQSIDSKLSPENLTILRMPISTETYDLWKKTLGIVHKIDKKKHKVGVNSVFLTLFLHMGLQLFNDVKLATDSLNELFSCYERVKKDKKSRRSLDASIVNGNTTLEHESDPLWIEVVTDLFLNLLSHSSHLLRSMIKCVFPHLCQFMTSTTIEQIVSVLDPKNDENPLSKGDESGSDSEDEDNDKTESEDESNDEEDNSEDEDDPDDDAENDETASDKLRMALHHVLSKDGTHSDDESIDLDQMSDSEGEKLDKALADAFRQFRPNHGKRKKQSKDQEALTHFRVRVLDLIEIYLDSNPSMLLSLEIMLPLLQSVEFSIRDEHQKPLNNRLKSILKKLLGLKKFSDTQSVNDNILVELLRSLLDKGSKNSFIVQDMGEQISDCCIFVVKCSEILKGLESTPKKVKKHLKSGILEILSGELHQFFNKRDSLTPYVLFKNLLLLPWEGNIGLAIILHDFLFDEGIRRFKKNQVAELLKIFYTNQRFLNQNLEKINGKMQDIHKAFSDKVIKFLKDLCKNPEQKSMKERFICLFLNLLTAIKQSPLNTDNIDWSAIANGVREYRSYKSFSNDAKLAYNRLCKSLGMSNVVAMKNNVTKLASLIETENKEGMEEVQGKKNKQNRKRKNKETLKLKKEAKKLRLEGLGKGLGAVEFNNTKIDVAQHPEDMDESIL